MIGQVAPIWANQPAVVCGAGPSLHPADLARIRAATPRPRVFVVNSAYQFAPWADVLYAADAQWWEWQQAVPDSALPPRLYAAQPSACQFRPSLQILHVNATDELSTDPSRLACGGHSGYQAINLAVLFGCRPILLLGFDMMPAPDGRNHCHPEHPNRMHPTYDIRIPTFATLRQSADAINCRIVNCSRQTAIPDDVLPRAPLDQTLRLLGCRSAVPTLPAAPVRDLGASGPAA